MKMRRLLLSKTLRLLPLVAFFGLSARQMREVLKSQAANVAELSQISSPSGPAAWTVPVPDHRRPLRPNVLSSLLLSAPSGELAQPVAVLELPGRAAVSVRPEGESRSLALRGLSPPPGAVDSLTANSYLRLLLASSIRAAAPPSL